MSRTLTITGVGASSLARADRRSLSDPYFVLRLNGEVVHQSSPIRNDQSPSWEAELSFPIEAGDVTLELALVDKDQRGRDDPLGAASTQLSGAGGRSELQLGGDGAASGSTAWIDWALATEEEEASFPEKQPAAPAPSTAEDAGPWWEKELPTSPPVVRKEIRKMSAAEQSRYADAVDKMMEAVDGEPGSSQYFRVASCAPPVSLPLPVHPTCGICRPLLSADLVTS